MKKFLALLLLAPSFVFAQTELLQIIDKDKSFTVNTPKGPIEITRVTTPCAKNKGWLQPLIPIKGTHPVDEIDVLHALNDKNSIVVDMPVIDDRVKGTIPGSVGIPYTEVAMRMNELGCKKLRANKNGIAQKPQRYMLSAMVRDGFPPNKIYYYRGGMLDGVHLV